MKNLSIIWQFIVAHDLIAFYVLAVLVDQLPAATATSSAFYKYFFGVTQLLAANWVRGKKGIQGTLSAPEPKP